MSLVSEQFQTFANEVDETSELYKNLSLKVAQDQEILALAERTRGGQPRPNLLFGAVHYLLLGGKPNPLSRYYPSITMEPESAEYAFPAFRKFVLTHEGEILKICAHPRGRDFATPRRATRSDERGAAIRLPLSRDCDHLSSLR